MGNATDPGRPMMEHVTTPLEVNVPVIVDKTSEVPFTPARAAGTVRYVKGKCICYGTDDTSGAVHSEGSLSWYDEVRQR